MRRPLLLTKTVVSFNGASTDWQIPVLLPTGYTNYLVDKATLSNASGTLTAATVGLFTAAGATGNALITQSTAVTVSTSGSTNNNVQSFVINNQSVLANNQSTLYFRVGGGTAAQTGTVTLYIRPLS